MEQGYLIDTNAIIDYLDNKLPEKSNLLLDHLLIQISFISRIELLAWQKASENQLKLLSSFISLSNVIGIDEAITLKTIEIRKTHNLKLPDAIIATTAVVNNLILVTRNVNDFKRIPKLRLRDPYLL